MRALLGFLCARRHAAAFALLLAAGVAPLVPTAAPAQDSAAARQPRRSSALFASDTLVRLTITAPLRELAGERDTLRPKLFPLSVAYDGPDGQRVTVPGRVATRGHFRLRAANCGFPPLRLVFGDTATRRTLFARQRALKLVTHCRDREARYEQHVLREYLAYRVHNLVSPLSLRPRLARVRYVDARDTARVLERYAFLLESERELADRHGGKILEQRGALYDHVDEESGAMLALFEYFIGNNDWSMSYLHNVRLIATAAGPLAVPYDFDFSGLVDTPYAAPDPRLGIRTVKERLYRGPCLTAERLTPLLARFTAARPAIVALYDSLPDLDRGYARRAVQFLDQFYDETRDVRQFARIVNRGCVAGT